MTTKHNRLHGEDEACPEKEVGPNRANGAAHEQNDYGDFTRNDDPLRGWHELGKPARLSRQQKRTWRRKSGGAINAELLALLILAVVAGLLLAGVIR